jgi:hypothetical protein
MNRICWWLVDMLCGTLDSNERDAVRGDIDEAGESGGEALRDSIGLVVRRQMASWKSWRAWVAPVGLIAPVVCAGTGAIRLDLQARTMWTYGVRFDDGLPLGDLAVRLVGFSMLPAAWAWIGGFAFGRLAGRTAWVHPAVIGVAVWVAAAMLRARIWMVPFLWGIYRGARGPALDIRRAMWLGLGIAVLTANRLAVGHYLRNDKENWKCTTYC